MKQTEVTRFLVFLFALGFGFLILIVIGLSLENRQLELEIQKAHSYIQNPLESQLLLQQAGYYKGDLDGIWGEETEAAHGNWIAAQYIEGKL